MRNTYVYDIPEITWLSGFEVLEKAGHKYTDEDLFSFMIWSRSSNIEREDSDKLVAKVQKELSSLSAKKRTEFYNYLINQFMNSDNIRSYMKPLELEKLLNAEILLNNNIELDEIKKFLFKMRNTYVYDIPEITWLPEFEVLEKAGYKYANEDLFSFMIWSRSSNIEKEDSDKLVAKIQKALSNKSAKERTEYYNYLLQKFMSSESLGSYMKPLELEKLLNAKILLKNNIEPDEIKKFLFTMKNTYVYDIPEITWLSEFEVLEKAGYSYKSDDIKNMILWSRSSNLDDTYKDRLIKKIHDVLKSKTPVERSEDLNAYVQYLNYNSSQLDRLTPREINTFLLPEYLVNNNVDDYLIAQFYNKMMKKDKGNKSFKTDLLKAIIKNKNFDGLFYLVIELNATTEITYNDIESIFLQEHKSFSKADFKKLMTKELFESDILLDRKRNFIYLLPEFSTNNCTLLML